MAILTAKELKEHVDKGTRMVGPRAASFLRKEGEEYVMYGLTGVNRLTICVTDAERLLAHWEGFQFKNAVRYMERVFDCEFELMSQAREHEVHDIVER